MSAAGGAGGGAQQKRHTPVPPPGRPSGGPKAPPWENLMKMLECTVCFEIMEGSIFQCEQGHCLCNVCYGRLAVREDTGCPTCSAVLGQIRCRFAEEVRDQFLRGSDTHHRMGASASQGGGRGHVAVPKQTTLTKTANKLGISVEDLRNIMAREGVGLQDAVVIAARTKVAVSIESAGGVSAYEKKRRADAYAASQAAAASNSPQRDRQARAGGGGGGGLLSPTRGGDAGATHTTSPPEQQQQQQQQQQQPQKQQQQHKASTPRGGACAKAGGREVVGALGRESGKPGARLGGMGGRQPQVEKEEDVQWLLAKYKEEIKRSEAASIPRPLSATRSTAATATASSSAASGKQQSKSTGGGDENRMSAATPATSAGPASSGAAENKAEDKVWRKEASMADFNKYRKALLKERVLGEEPGDGEGGSLEVVAPWLRSSEDRPSTARRAWKPEGIAEEGEGVGEEGGETGGADAVAGGEPVAQSGEEEKREKVDDDDDDDDDDGGVPCFGVASGGGALATSSVSPIAAPRPVGDDYQGQGRGGTASHGVSLTGSATAAAAAAAVLGLSGPSDTGVAEGEFSDGVEGCGQAGATALTEELAEVRMRQQAQHDAQVMSAAAVQERERKEKEKEKEKDREAAARAIAAAASSLSQPRHHAPDLDAAPPIQPRPRTGSSATGSRASQNTPSPTGDAPPQVPQLVLPGISESSRPSTDDSNGHRSTRSTPTFEALTSDRVASLVALNSNKMPGVGAAPLTDRARPPSSAPDLSRGKTPRAPLSAREATNNTGGGGGGDSIADALEGVRKGDRTGAVWKIVSGVRRRLRKGNGGAMW